MLEDVARGMSFGQAASWLMICSIMTRLNQEVVVEGTEARVVPIEGIGGWTV